MSLDHAHDRQSPNELERLAACLPRALAELANSYDRGEADAAAAMRRLAVVLRSRALAAPDAGLAA